MNDPIKQLKELHKLKELGILTQEEFDQQKQSLLTQNLSHEKIARPVETSTSMELMAGVDIGARGRQFRLVKQIGRGGMGQVWQARDLAEEAAFSEEPIYKALKVVNANMMHSSGAIKKLQKEAINVAKLSHPNIINVNGWHQGEEGWLFIEMEFLQGEDLDAYLGDYNDGLSWEQSLPILQAIAEGLHYAHTQHSLIHRDLKPGNIFITEQQNIKILDFGLAYRLRKSSMNNVQQADTSGVAEYMPPEAFLAGKPDARHDVYAFACLVYELLTGEVPFSKEKAVNRPVDDWPPKPERLTDSSWAVLKQGLAYKKEQRTEGVKQCLNELVAGQAPKKEKKTHTKIVEKVEKKEIIKPRKDNKEKEQQQQLTEEFDGTDTVIKSLLLLVKTFTSNILFEIKDREPTDKSDQLYFTKIFSISAVFILLTTAVNVLLMPFDTGSGYQFKLESKQGTLMAFLFLYLALQIFSFFLQRCHHYFSDNFSISLGKLYQCFFSYLLVMNLPFFVYFLHNGDIPHYSAVRNTLSSLVIGFFFTGWAISTIHYVFIIKQFYQACNKKKTLKMSLLIGISCLMYTLSFVFWMHGVWK